MILELSDDATEYGRQTRRAFESAGGDQLLQQADELLYNASAGEVDATSNEGNNVTLLEPKSGTPMTARRILWNLKSGRIEVKQPGTIVAPR